MTDAERAAIHAAAMAVPRPWRIGEIGALRLMPGMIDLHRPGAFALGRVTLDEAELLTIAVHPDHQRQGVGAALLVDFQDAASVRGATRCFLEVAELNTGARALYAKAGYTESGRRRGYYTDATPAQDAILMSRAL